MATPSDETKNRASKMTLGGIGKSLLGGAKKTAGVVKKLFAKKPTSELIDKTQQTPTEVLGEIYKMLKIMEEDKRLNHEMANSFLEEQELEKEQRNKEIIKALTGRKVKKPKVKPLRDEKGRFKKVEETPTTPTAPKGGTQPPTPTPPAPKGGTQPPATTPAPKAGTQPPAQPPAKPVTQAPAQPPTQPPVKPPAQSPTPPAKPAAQPPVKPATQTPAQPPAKPAAQPPVKPQAQPAPKPATQAPAAPPKTSSVPVIPTITGVAVSALANDAMARIKEKEGFFGTAYPDPKGQTEKYSVGYGHQITEKEWKQGYILVGNKKIPTAGYNGKETKMQKEDAAELVKLDYPKYEEYAKKLPNFDKLNKQAQIALIDMTYNMGVGWAHPHGNSKGWPILLKQLENLELDEASKNILSTKYSRDVGKRAVENAESIKKGLEGVPKQENMPTQNSKGNQLNQSSIENQDGKKELNAQQQNISGRNTTVINQQGNVSSSNIVKEDDRPAWYRKLFRSTVD